MIWDLARYGQTPALIEETGAIITYEKLADAAANIAALAGHRQLVFCFCKNEVGAIAGYIAFLNHGIVPVLLDPNLDKDLRDNLIEVYRPSLLWLPESLAQVFSAYDKVGGAYGYALLRSKNAVSTVLHDDLALLLTTSGSTGSPKLVRQSYGNVIANTQSIIEYLAIRPGERTITTLPMYYTYGLSIIQTYLYSGGTIILTDKSFMQKEFWDLARVYKAMSFGGVPYTYEMLYRLRFFKMDLPDLLVMTQAGGKLGSAMQEKFAVYAEQSGKKFIVMYGAAEATARMSYLPAEKSLEKCGSIGIAIPGGRFELIDDHGAGVMTSDTVGELVYYGDNVTLGYAESRDDLAKGDERQGRLATGDMAKRDDDGYYYIVGRKKRFLKLFGKRVNLDEAEQLLKQHFGCMDIACSGIDDKLYVFTVQEAIAGKAKAFLSAKIAIHPSAVVVRCIESIPKNESGKTQYKELVKYYVGL